MGSCAAFISGRGINCNCIAGQGQGWMLMTGWLMSTDPVILVSSSLPLPRSTGNALCWALPCDPSIFTLCVHSQTSIHRPLPRPPCLLYANLSLSRTFTPVHELGCKCHMASILISSHKCHMASILISGHFPFHTKWMTR